MTRAAERSRRVPPYGGAAEGHGVALPVATAAEVMLYGCRKSSGSLRSQAACGSRGHSWGSADPKLIGVHAQGGLQLAAEAVRGLPAASAAVIQHAGPMADAARRNRQVSLPAPGRVRRCSQFFLRPGRLQVVEGTEPKAESPSSLAHDELTHLPFLQPLRRR